MGALRDVDRNALMDAFKLRGFSEMYLMIEQTYKQYNLGSDLCDEDRISEYQWVNEQLRKFVSTKQNEVIDYGSDVDGMIVYVRNLMNTLSEYASTRKGLVYNVMRNMWLNELTNVLDMIESGYILDEAEGEEE